MRHKLTSCRHAGWHLRLETVHALRRCDLVRCSTCRRVFAEPPTAEPPAAAGVDVRRTIERGVAFLAKDAVAWRDEHHCASCHHAALIAWSLREAKERGHAVDEPVLAEMTKWLTEAGAGKTGVPRPEGIPKALNVKAVLFSLGLEAKPQPSEVEQAALTRMLGTVKSDQTDDGSWDAWPETRPPIFGPSDEAMTALATLASIACRGQRRSSCQGARPGAGVACRARAVWRPAGRQLAAAPVVPGRPAGRGARSTGHADRPATTGRRRLEPDARDGQRRVCHRPGFVRTGPRRPESAPIRWCSGRRPFWPRRSAKTGRGP